MMRRLDFNRGQTIALVLAVFLGLSNQPVVRAQPADPSAVAAYIDGIDALDAGDFPRAVQALTAAVGADGDNASYRRARGVAYTLNESFANAITDLDRARQLDSNDTEAALWLAAAYRMNGDPAKGASVFTMRDLPHDYANMVYNVMAMQYWQSKFQGFYIDPGTHQRVPAKTAVKTLFPEAAKEYADRNRATGAAAAEAITAQVKKELAGGDWALALRDLRQLRANSLDDPELRGYWAQALVGAGNALRAREEFTRTLCIMPLWADGYVGRAQAHAMLGDQPRAQADLEAAASMGAGTIDALRQQLSAAAVPPASPDAVAQFVSAVRADAPFDKVVEDALAVHRLTNTNRKRYDESYQLRIRVLSEMMRDRPTDSDYPETLGRYLFNHYQVPVVWNGPRGGDIQLRPQSAVERDNELKRGIELCDAALKIDPKNANALATKGWILYTIKAAGPEALADQGLAINPDNIRLLDLKIRILNQKAAECLAEAGGLRAGRTESHDETRADGVYHVTTHYPPTADDLARAAQLEARAAELREQANQLQTHEKDVTEHTIPAMLERGRAALAAGDLPAAHKALLAAYADDPDRNETLTLLATLSNKEGDARQGQVYSLLTQPLEETTAAPQLQSAWDSIVHTRWQAAAQSLDQGAAIDPSDARIAAYRSVIEANRDKRDPTAAKQWRNAALALEEARARESGTTLLADHIPPINLLDLPTTGLSMAVHLQAGNAALAGGDFKTARDQFAANVALEKRRNAQSLIQLVPTAMLPEPTQAPAVVPQAPTFASLLADSRLGLAKRALESHEPSEAATQYTAVRGYLANWPATAANRETMIIADSWARLGQAEAAYAAHNVQETRRILESDGWPFGLPADLETRRKKLADQVHSELSGQMMQGMRQQANQSPADAQPAALQQEIAALQKQRDAMAADLADPNLSARDRQVRQSSISQLDDLIAQRKAALAKPADQGR
jgi:hypothetical protein